MTPLLVLGFGIPPIVAVGTDLIYAAATKSLASLLHGLQGSVQWRTVGLLALGSLPATFLTLNILEQLQADIAMLDSVIRSALSLALLLTAIFMMFRQRLLNLFQNRPSPTRCATNITITVISGAVLGLLVTITSIGAGALGLVILSLLYPRLKTSQLVGTDLAHAVPLTAIAGFGHWQLGSVDSSLLMYLLLGSLPGVIVGSLLCRRLPEKVMRYTLAIVLFGVGIKLLA